ncbi:hypothetical protein U9M48_031094 [Paspalum notatum var. saurae]|uniref:Uncharacterized protein n=1 Tax=Paspalum notatum var. saurae TaxID=547442 RepID=A0AAQ3X4D5_PASNO
MLLASHHMPGNHIFLQQSFLNTATYKPTVSTKRKAYAMSMELVLVQKLYHFLTLGVPVAEPNIVYIRNYNLACKAYLHSDAPTMEPEDNDSVPALWSPIDITSPYTTVENIALIDHSSINPVSAPSSNTD